MHVIWLGSTGAKKNQQIAYTEDLCEVLEQAYEEADADRERLQAQRRALDSCMKQLPEASRNLIKQHYLEGIRIVDIALRMSRSAESVRMLLMRIRNILRICIRSHAEVEERA